MTAYAYLGNKKQGKLWNSVGTMREREKVKRKRVICTSHSVLALDEEV